MTSRKSQSDDALALLEAEARAVAKSFGIQDCDAAAAALMDRIAMRLGGAHIYVSKRRHTSSRNRLEAVRRMYDGSNPGQVARELGISPRHLRRLVAQIYEEDRAKCTQVNAGSVSCNRGAEGDDG